MLKTLIGRYFDDISDEHPKMIYIKSFIKNFHNLSSEDVKGTVWEPLWWKSANMTKEKLESAILNLATTLTSYNGLWAKHTDQGKK